MGVSISGAIATFDGTGVLTRVFVNSVSLQGVSSVVITGYDGIGQGAFSYFSNLTSVTISASVTSIGDYAFYNCSNLSSISIPSDSQLSIVGNFAFQGCPASTSISIPFPA